jgi:hypothetical protein
VGINQPKVVDNGANFRRSAAMTIEKLSGGQRKFKIFAIDSTTTMSLTLTSIRLMRDRCIRASIDAANR